MAKETDPKPTAHGASYDRAKVFEGKRYTGMAVGRGHKWRYDAGVWSEKKRTPDDWDFRYAVIKRRAGKAPEGSGAPIGTAYHWYILADQIVTKLDANSYATEMVGRKVKLAHKRADKNDWNANDRAQRKRLAALLRKMADELDAEAAQSGRTASTRSRDRKPYPVNGKPSAASTSGPAGAFAPARDPGKARTNGTVPRGAQRAALNPRAAAAKPGRRTA